MMAGKTVRQLGVLAKYWAPGDVKTRLAQAVGDQAAARLAREFLRCSLRRLERVDCRQRVLSYWPRQRRSEFARLAGPSWRLNCQSEGDLGERLRACFDQAWHDGASQTVLLGADSPSLPLERIEQAFASLERSPLALGPTDDGGYYLMGARPPTPPLFAGVQWGTAAVWQQTIDLARRHHLDFAELNCWFDVDQWEDLQRLRSQLHRVDEAELAELAAAVEQLLEPTRDG